MAFLLVKQAAIRPAAPQATQSNRLLNGGVYEAGVQSHKSGVQQKLLAM